MKIIQTITVLGSFILLTMAASPLHAQQMRGLGLKLEPLDEGRRQSASKAFLEFESLRRTATGDETFDGFRDTKVMGLLKQLQHAEDLGDIGVALKDAELIEKGSKLEDKTYEEFKAMGKDIVPYLVDSWLYELGQYFYVQTLTQSDLQTGKTEGADFILVDSLKSQHIDRGSRIEEVLKKIDADSITLLSKVKAAADAEKAKNKNSMSIPVTRLERLISEIKFSVEDKKSPRKSGMLDQNGF